MVFERVLVFGRGTINSFYALTPSTAFTRSSGSLAIGFFLPPPLALRTPSSTKEFWGSGVAGVQGEKNPALRSLRRLPLLANHSADRCHSSPPPGSLSTPLSRVGARLFALHPRSRRPCSPQARWAAHFSGWRRKNLLTPYHRFASSPRIRLGPLGVRGRDCCASGLTLARRPAHTARRSALSHPPALSLSRSGLVL